MTACSVLPETRAMLARQRAIAPLTLLSQVKLPGGELQLLRSAPLIASLRALIWSSLTLIPDLLAVG